VRPPFAYPDDDRVHAYCRERGIPILLEVTEDRAIAESYSRGELIVDSLPRYRPLFEGLARRLRETGLRSHMVTKEPT
jgi:MinD superfamily P-loop ATPase